MLKLNELLMIARKKRPFRLDISHEIRILITWLDGRAKFADTWPPAPYRSSRADCPDHCRQFLVHIYLSCQATCTWQEPLDLARPSLWIKKHKLQVKQMIPCYHSLQLQSQRNQTSFSSRTCKLTSLEGNKRQVNWMRFLSQANGQTYRVGLQQWWLSYHVR